MPDSAERPKRPEWWEKYRKYAEAAKPFEQICPLDIEGREELVRFAMYNSPSRALEMFTALDAAEARIAALEAERDSLRTVLPMLELAEAQKEAACNLLRAEQAEAREAQATEAAYRRAAEKVHSLARLHKSYADHPRGQDMTAKWEWSSDYLSDAAQQILVLLPSGEADKGGA